MLRTLMMLGLSICAFSAVAQEAVHNITHVKGNLYRYNNASHVSVFYIGEDGVLVTDPISAGDAAWLRDEIAQMTDKPIKYLVFSHSHADHASGGQEFGDLEMVIGHENMPEEMDGVQFTRKFGSVLGLGLGGDSSVELVYLGPGHGTALIAMLFRPENAVFVVDAASVSRLPYQDLDGGVNLEARLDQIRKVESLDFDIFVGGHGPVGTKQDVVAHRQYIEALRSAVQAGLDQGMSLEQLKSEIMMEEYADWLNYENWRELNIEGMVKHLQM